MAIKTACPAYLMIPEAFNVGEQIMSRAKPEIRSPNWKFDNYRKVSGISSVPTYSINKPCAMLNAIKEYVCLVDRV
jgi:hypothetical protein